MFAGEDQDREDEMSESEDLWPSQPSSTTSFDDDPSELVVGSIAESMLDGDQKQSNNRLVPESRSKIRTHRRSFSSPVVPSFVSFEKPNPGFATFPRPKSAAHRTLRPRSASTDVRSRPASAHIQRSRSASTVIASTPKMTPVPEDEEKYEMVVKSVVIHRIEDGDHHELVLNEMKVPRIEEEGNHELVVNRIESRMH